MAQTDETKLTSIEVNLLLCFFVYYMPMPQRQQLMDEHPVAYHKLMNLVRAAL